MRHIARGPVVGLFVLAGLAFLRGPTAYSEEASSSQKPVPSADLEVPELRIRVIPTPADPELEQVMQEVQDGLSTIHQQMVRHKEALKATSDPAEKARLYEEFESLRKERESFEAILHHLVDEARLSERTAIDEALARTRELERELERWERKADAIRDRQQ